MSETIRKTRIADTVRMQGPPVARSRASAVGDASSTNGSSTTGSTAKRSLPPGALRSDHVDVSGAPRRNFRPLATGVAVIFGLVIVGLVLRSVIAPPPVTQETVAVLEIVHGTIEIFPANGGQVQSRLLPLAGASISAGMVIETGAAAPGDEPPGTATISAPALTTGAALTAVGAAAERPDGSGRAALRLASGASLRLDVDTRVRMASASALVLERGAVYVDTEGVDDDTSVEVRTTLGVVRDVGTQFEVRLEPDAGGEPLRIRVREGTVRWSRGDETHDAGVGEELAVSADGTVNRGAAPVHGPHWGWVLATAPMPELEGRPLRAFLDWYVREGGWTLRFADDAVAELAASTILHGEADGLTPEEAASMVLRGSGLESRLEEGVLWVEAVAGP